jgi:hypothetical protein
VIFIVFQSVLTASTSNFNTQHAARLLQAYGARAGRDDEPDLLGQVEDGLDKVIEVYSTQLIPNAHCCLNNIASRGIEVADDLQTLWHDIAEVEVNFWKAKSA